MDFKITILGANSALPAHGRYPSAQYLQIHNHHILVDCGEGTQMRLRETKAKWAKINHIFISHLHGDHFFGLPGFLTSLSLLGRKDELTVHGPDGIANVIDHLFSGCGVLLKFQLNFNELDASKSSMCFENNVFEVSTIPLDHRIPTNGYLFREKVLPRNIIGDKIVEYDLSIDQIKAAKAGSDIKTSDGKIIANSDLTKAPAPPRSYAYCSDTRYNPDIIPLVSKVNLLYHEATYLHDRLDLAEYSMHTTALEAGQLAKAAKVDKLIIGHYSSRYEDLAPLLEEATSAFKQVELAINGRIFHL